MFNKMIQFTMKRSVLIIVFLSMIVAWGGISAFQMKRDYLPSIHNTTMMVTIRAPHYEALQVKESIAKPMEEAINKTDGIAHIETSSFNGGVAMSLYFPMNYDMEKAQIDVNRAVTQADLPTDVDSPLVSLMTNNSFPVLSYGLTSKSDRIDELKLRTTVQLEMTHDILSVPGVSQVRTIGGGKKGYVLLLRTKDLADYQLTPDDVYNSISQRFPALGSGKVSVNQVAIPLVIEGSSVTQDELDQITITNSKGTSVPLNKIGHLEQSVTDSGTVSRTNGQPSVMVDVLKTPSSNITKVGEAVKQRLHENPYIKSNEVQADLLLDREKDLTQSLTGLLREGLLGIAFSMLCVFLFFRKVRSTLLIALSIPISLLATTAVLKWMGITLNILTVSGLIVAMGRIVDDSIVVLDNMYRHMNTTKGKDRVKVLAEGALEMMPAILASTATTIAVYIPIALVGGYVTATFAGFAWSVVIALIVSFFVAILVVPALTYLGLRDLTDRSVTLEPMMKPVLEYAFKHKKLMMTITSCLFLGAIVLGTLLPVNLLPTGKSGQVAIKIELPKGTSINEVDQQVKEVESILQDDSEVKNYTANFGASLTPQSDDVFDQGGGFLSQPNVANISLQLKDEALLNKFINKMNNELDHQSGNAIYTVTNQNISGDDSQINIQLTGADQATLENATLKVRENLIDIKGFSVEGQASLKHNTPSINVQLDKNKIMQSGVDLKDINKVIQRYLVNGNDFYFKVENRVVSADTSIDALHTKSMDTAQSSIPIDQVIRSLKNEKFMGSNGKMFSLKDFADITKEQIPSMIRVRDGKPYALVSGQVTSKDVGEVGNQVKDQLQSLNLPNGVTYSLGGISEQVKTMITNMALALGFSILMIVLITSAVFKGWRAPLSVLISIPLALSGVVLAMYFSHSQWNLAALIGVLMLSGIVVTNGIVLIDRIEKNITSGLSKEEGIINGSLSRVRPIFMTAGTTILTLLPLALSHSGTTVISQTLGIVVIGGMVTSTFNSFIVIPIIYNWLSNKGAFALETPKNLGMK